MYRAVLGMILTGVVTLAVAQPVLAAPAESRGAVGHTLAEFVAERSARAGQALGALSPAGTWIPSTGVSRAAWESAVADDSVRVDDTGRAFVVEPALNMAQVARASAASVQPALPYGGIDSADAFNLASRPGADRTIFLDFDGHVLSGTAWNTPSGYDIANGYEFAAFSYDDDFANFSTTERQAIIQAWSLVAEDYAPFDVNVTTINPGAAALERTSAEDTQYGARSVITGFANPIAQSCGCGGIAYVGVFGLSTEFSADYSPAFTFAGAGFSGKVIADIASHEVGHNVGLAHDGRALAGEEYYMGHGSWAPLMGAAYDHPISQWSNGDYVDASNPEDDFATMAANNLPLVSDAVGDTSGTATSITSGVSTAGLIETRADIDMFSYVAEGDTLTATVRSPALIADLDVELSIYDSEGVLLGSNNPVSAQTSSDTVTGLDADLTVASTPGSTYFLAIDGVGVPGSTGYSDYGSVGEYRILIEQDSLPAIPVQGTPTASGTAKYGTNLTGARGTWSTGATFHYAWLRDGVATGDTDTSYAIQVADIGHEIEFQVTAHLLGYQTAIVTSAPRTITAGTLTTATPRIWGTPKVGVALSASPGAWSPTPYFSYVWKRGTTVVGTGTTYIPKAADRGYPLTVTVTGTKSGYASASRVSAPSAAVAYGTISPSPVPTISGTKKLGYTLTANRGTWMSGVTITYQWQRCSAYVSTCWDIVGATSSMHRVTTTDVGRRIRVVVKATKPGYSSVWERSALTVKVTR